MLMKFVCNLKWKIGDDLDWKQVRKDTRDASRWKGNKVGGWEGIWRQSCARKNIGI